MDDLRDDIALHRSLRQPERFERGTRGTLMRFAEVRKSEGRPGMLIRKDGCMHCEDPGCLKACPSPGASCNTPTHRRFPRENCIGCGYCVTGCPFDVPRHLEETRKRINAPVLRPGCVGLEPGLREACPTGAIVFGTKEDMKQHAEERIEALKSRGFDQSGPL